MPAPRSALADSVYSTIGVLAQGLSRFGYTALVARFLGADSLATVNLAFSVAILLSLMWPTAAGNAAAAYVRPGHNSHAVRRWLQRSTLAATAVSTPIALTVGMLLGLGVIPAVLTGLLTVTWSAYIFTRGLRMGHGQVRAAAAWDAISGAVSLILLIVVLVYRLESWLIAPAAIGYAVFALACLLAKLAVVENSSEDHSDLPPLRPTIAWNSVSLIASNGLMQLTMVVAFAFDTAAQAGFFAAALSLATPMSMVAQAVTLALLPRFLGWRAQGRAKELSLLRRTSLTLALVVAFGCASVAVVLPWALPLVYGNSFAGAVPLAQWMIVAVFGFSMSVFFTAYLSAVGRARTATLAGGSAAIGGALIMTTVGIVAGGVAGALLGAVVGMTLSAGLLALLALRPPSLS